ncbi:hypothetical protein CLV63_108104 [Murinocardiopsis flavida]|uniref:Uncharacterized protein n=2 Tax=Murinocardiopsis flavida TaxID=645275 RepID=A0A2P8DJI7_9ACTN|nr:hypothetical protein CLV63_108104 [Murinocardiopsis flavida]
METKEFALKPFADARGIALRGGGSGMSAESAGMAYGLQARVVLMDRAAESHWTTPVVEGTPRPKGAVGKCSRIT